MNCESGHYGVVVFDARRYEVLVTSAARAFLDGYTNEVVAVMSSALERSYEFYIRVSCRAKGISEDKLDSAWKSVSAQSERQFGAFQFLYLLDCKVAFELDSAITQTRNSVIHRGKIVRESEALEFAEQTYAVIQQIESTLNAKFPSFTAEEAEREVKAQEKKIPEGVEHFRLSTTTVKIDNVKNEVIGRATKFMDHVAAIHQSRERGLPG